MLLSYEVVTAFGVSALVSFTVFSTILLAIVSKSGLLQGKKKEKQALSKQIVHEKLLRPQDIPAPTAPELTPPSARHLLGPQAS